MSEPGESINVDAPVVSFFTHDDLLFCGLNEFSISVLDAFSYSKITKLATKRVVNCMLPIDEDHILTLEKDGFIEIINTKKLEIVYTTQHSSKISINQGIQT